MVLSEHKVVYIVKLTKAESMNGYIWCLLLLGGNSQMISAYWI